MFTSRIFALPTAMTLAFAGTAHADDVEIYLTDILDSTQIGYCVDIAGGREADAVPADGLQSHTCYSNLGALGLDQTFDTEKFADGQLYMTEFDVCAELASTEAGSSIALNACDGSDLQQFVFSGEGTITAVSAPEMCLTAGEETRSGRSDANQIKTLTLEACSDDLTAYQDWAVRGVE